MGQKKASKKRPQDTAEEFGLDQPVKTLPYERWARVALVGRPNVGKSTLFNKLVGRARAIVHDEPGVTRDWQEADAKIGVHSYVAVDTAGLEATFDDSLASRMRQQTETAVTRADLVLFMFDARAGITPVDEQFAQWARSTGKPVWLIGNKCEGRAGEDGLNEAYALGFGEALPLSAEHNEGLGELYSRLIGFLELHEATPGDEDAAAPDSRSLPGQHPDKAQAVDRYVTITNADGEEFEIPADEPERLVEIEDVRPLQLAVVGRPNVGKSTLINRLVGEDRMLTGPEAGITRDAVSVDLQWQGRRLRIFDTAGLRRKAKVVEKLEQMSAQDTLEAIRFAQVVILVLDSDAVLDKQDLQIARHCFEEGRALVVAINKWDQVVDPEAVLSRLKNKLDLSLAQVKGIPTVTISAQEGRNLDKMLDKALEVRRTWATRVSTSLLNQWLAYHTGRHPPPMVNGRRIKLRFATQIKSKPPTVAVFGSRVDDLPGAYRQYLTNSLREDFDLWGSPIRLVLRAGNNPYIKQKK